MGKVSSIFLLTLIATLATARATANNNTDPSPLKPSRYAGQDVAKYTSEISSLFTIAKRITDPFCQPQDPNAKPIVRPSMKKIARRSVSAEPTKQLSHIVAQIPITTMMPREKRFLVGSRSISQGELLTLNHQNKLIRTKVTEVSSERVVFTTIETGEEAVRVLSLMPAGMSPGQNQITPAGMQRQQADAPLEISSVPAINQP